MADDIMSGVGARYAVFLPNDPDTGLPHPTTSTQTPYVGVVIEGLKSVSVTEPEPQRITHVGDDRPYAQDTLPSTDFQTFQFTTSKNNMVLDGTLDGSKIRTAGTDAYFRMASNDNKGNEVRGTMWAYRQALNTDRSDAANFGKKRLYHSYVWPSVQISRQTASFEAAGVDITYDGTPTNVRKVPWSDALDTTDWGVTEGAMLEGSTRYHPRFNSWYGNGTIGIWNLSHPPVDSNHIMVWAGTEGSVVPVIAVGTGANPTLSIGTIGVGIPIFALIQTNSPNADLD